MARYHFGGSPWDVIQDVTGAVVPDWPVEVYAPDDAETPLTDLLEAGSDLPISELRSNPESDADPGLIRTFRGPDGLTEIVYQFSGPDGRSHRWHEPAHEVAGSISDAEQALSISQTALSSAQAAQATANQAQQSADIARARAVEAEVVAGQAQDAASSYISSVSPSASVGDLQPPLYVPWRTGSNIAPENSIEGLDTAVAMDFRAVHVTARHTLDGALFCFGDGPIYNMTSLAGATTDQTSAGVERARILAGNWFCNTWMNDLRVPLLSRIISRAQKRIVVIIELLDTGSVPAAVNLIKRMRAETYTILMSTERNALRDVAVPAGVNACLLDTNPASTNHALVVADGINYYALNVSQSASYLSDAASAGLQVFAHDVQRMHQRDTLPQEILGVITRDPVWMDPSRDHLLPTDPHGSGSFYHGHIGLANGFNSANPGIGVQRGHFLSSVEGTGKLQFKLSASTNPASYDRFQAVVMGWACPLPNPDSYTLTGTIMMQVWSSSTRWMGIGFGRMTDHPWDNNFPDANRRGYLLLVRQSGAIELWRQDGDLDPSQTMIASGTTSAFTGGGTKTFSITVTPTSISCTLGGQTINSTDTAYRGPFCHYTTDQCDGRFYDLAVS